MTLAVLLLGIILIVVAIRGTYSTLFAAIRQDVPDFFVWAAAIFAIGAIGFVPGLKPVSRGLLMLIIVVLLVNNYKSIIAGFKGVHGSTAASPSGTSANTSVTSVISGANSVASGIGNPLSMAPNIESFIQQLGS